MWGILFYYTTTCSKVNISIIKLLNVSLKIIEQITKVIKKIIKIINFLS